MRVIAGKYKRTNLVTLDGDLTRPTKDMVKEALFSSIVIDEDSCVLDLFSGSGSIGIEALSRGAKDAIFNDHNKDAVKIIKTNLEKIKEVRTVYNLDYETCLIGLKGHQFDFIYLDPPYKLREYEKMLMLINENDLLKDRGVIVIEVIKDFDFNEDNKLFDLYKIKKYGISKLLYLRRKDESIVSGII